MQTTWLKKWNAWLAAAIAAIGGVYALWMGNTIAELNGHLPPRVIEGESEVF